MTSTFFATQSDFRKWLTQNHTNEKELLVGFYKVGSGKPSLTWPQSVDEALCFGWIDGVRKSLDHESYCIRFTPRKQASIWSAVNIKRIKELAELGLMQPAGLKLFNNRQQNKSRIYAYENETKSLASHLEKNFQANDKAWFFFTAQAPSYQKVIIHWIMTAKQESTQLTRLDKTIAASEQQQRLK